MRGIILENVVMFTNNYLDRIIKEGWQCIDATLGHGKDVLFLSNKVGSQGHVYGFDIQEQAVESSSNMLKDQAIFDNYSLFQAGHETMATHVHGPINFIIFNLGYMPKGDKAITTKKTTTLVAVEEGLKLLTKNGLLWVVVYPGHDAGAVEAKGLETMVKTLDQKKYSVMKMQMMNQINNPPYIIAIEKKF